MIFIPSYYQNKTFFKILFGYGQDCKKTNTFFKFYLVSYSVFQQLTSLALK